MSDRYIRNVVPESAQPRTYLALPYLGEVFVPSEAFRLLWTCDYWDGPISGVCLYLGQRCWFDVVDDVHFTEWDEDLGEWDPCVSRRYAVYALTPEALAWEEEVHARFREHVGVHTTYDEHGRRPTENYLRPSSEHDKFYGWYESQPKRVVDRSRPLAWFGFPGPQPGEVDGAAVSDRSET
jgi:hypothetical protein